MQIILASASPRRQQLLNQIGLKHHVLPVDIDESPINNESPLTMVKRLAENKAIVGEQKAQQQFFGLPVLAADTVVVNQGKALGKPFDKHDHLAMLSSLSDSTHEVITAFSIKSGNKQYTEAVSTEVTFTHLTEAEITAYWLSGEPHDKAGGYGIQGYAGVFVKRLKGSYTGVVGLPLFECAQALKQFGVNL